MLSTLESEKMMRDTTKEHITLLSTLESERRRRETLLKNT